MQCEVTDECTGGCTICEFCGTVSLLTAMCNDHEHLTHLLAARLCQDPVGEHTVLPHTLYVDYEVDERV